MDIGPIHVLRTYVPNSVKYVFKRDHFPFSLDQKLDHSICMITERERLFRCLPGLIYPIQASSVGIQTEVRK